MMSKKYLQILLGFSFLYLIPELLFKDAMLYIAGGSVGGTIYELFKGIGVKLPSSVIFVIWILLIIGLILLFFRIRNKPLKYFILVLIGLLLYVVDSILSGIPIYNLASTDFAIIIDNVLLIFIVFIKALILTSIIYFNDKKRKVTQ